MDDLDKRIAEANDEFISDEEDIPEAPASVDVYQAQSDLRREEGRLSRPYGARELVMSTIKDVIGGVGAQSLARAYKRARDDSEALKKRGFDKRAQLLTNQYMEERFLPAVEVVVNFTSPDELLNCDEGLRELDKYALGVGSMSGYTAEYLRDAYGNSLGQVEQASSPMVEDAVQMAKGALDSYRESVARGIAEKMLKKIRKGETVASTADYVFLQELTINTLASPSASALG